MWNRWVLPFLGATMLVLSALACQVGTIPGFTGVRGSGRVVEETRQISGVRAVELATIGELTIEIGDAESLRIEAEDNLLEYLETEVRDGVLVIDTQRGANLMATRPVRYFLTVTAFDEIALSSSGNAVAPDLEAQRFTVRVSSSGDLQIGSVRADTLVVDMSSSGDVSMDGLEADLIRATISSSGSLEIGGGAVERQEITMGSSGNYRARELESREVEISVSSSGDAAIRVSDRLKATLSSSGDVEYVGRPPTVEINETSSGRARQIE